MNVFDRYARYYDLLYREKDYPGEAQHVHEIIQRNAPGAKSILELGCGTGAHAVYLAMKDYKIHGVDLSLEMLERAKKRLQGLAPGLASKISFSQGDIRYLHAEERLDAVIALFHVISYLPTNNDLKKTFHTARAHLKTGGIFLFDCWYGPAVLADRPSIRVKRTEDDSLNVVRIAEPSLCVNDNLVKINYQLLVRDKGSLKLEIVEETHLVRYFFKPEVELLFSQTGFQFLECFEWMTGREPGSDTWGVCFVARAKK